MRSIHSLSVIAVTVCATILFAPLTSQAADTAPAKTSSPAAAAAQATVSVKPAAGAVSIKPSDLSPAPFSMAKTPADKLAAFEVRLDADLKNLGPDVAPVDLYPAAKSRIHEALSLLKLDPKAKEAPAWVQACSLLTEASVTEMHTQALQIERLRLKDQRIAALSELSATQDEIAKLERGYSSSLKADLEEQKRKAAALKDEAEKRFSELNSALIQVSKDARGTIISMSDILFDVGKATLTMDLKTNLAKIAGILTIYKDANVMVEGHTDNVGGEEYNQKLSEKRASNVMDFLTSPGGIDAKRLGSQGFGFSKPIADNSTKEGRQKNRRVDLVIMDKKAPQ